MFSSTDALKVGQAFARGYNRALGKMTEDWGLSRAEVDVLLFLHNNPSCDTAREVVELRGMAKSGVSKAVDALVRRGYLAAVPDERDRRVVRLKLLPAARPAVEAGAAAQAAFWERLRRGISPQEGAVMAAVFAKLMDNMKDC
ncbi:MarR family winged helix-turn-helix transcriptional regulator [Bittarella massiliensis (ex Durand et al. 2017)]|uniref:MarR family winged helix-turn-helix transcriptional regulator n=1 Tax=Bittarella massiliensis (ex Durand et al. 2017) TaxID=1720313 RepID=UPI001AA0FDFF|nr:winged helix-turn-helix transcriptional regulator [Bittarella massiliensis (ex Durand et al. 2017)]